MELLEGLLFEGLLFEGLLFEELFGFLAASFWFWF